MTIEEIDAQLIVAIRRWQEAVDLVIALRRRRGVALSERAAALIAASMIEDGWPLPNDDGAEERERNQRRAAA